MARIHAYLKIDHKAALAAGATTGGNVDLPVTEGLLTTCPGFLREELARFCGAGTAGVHSPVRLDVISTDWGDIAAALQSRVDAGRAEKAREAARETRVAELQALSDDALRAQLLVPHARPKAWQQFNLVLSDVPAMCSSAAARELSTRLGKLLAERNAEAWADIVAQAMPADGDLVKVLLTTLDDGTLVSTDVAVSLGSREHGIGPRPAALQMAVDFAAEHNAALCEEQQKQEGIDRGAWIATNGSRRLQVAAREGIECEAIYRDERLAGDRPGWNWADDVEGDPDEPRNPPAEALLQLLPKARATLPDDERTDAKLVYWTRGGGGYDAGGDYCESQRGYAVAAEFMGRGIVYGPDFDFDLEDNDKNPCTTWRDPDDCDNDPCICGTSALDDCQKGAGR